MAVGEGAGLDSLGPYSPKQSYLLSLDGSSLVLGGWGGANHRNSVTPSEVGVRESSPDSTDATHARHRQSPSGLAASVFACD